MPDSSSATPPKSDSSSVGARRVSSDRPIHWSIVRTSAIGLLRIDGLHGRPQRRDSACGSSAVLTTSAMLGAGCLRHRVVDALLRHRLAEVDAVDRADDADDGEGRASRAAALDLLADRILVLEVAVHQVLVDDDHARGLSAASRSSNTRPVTSGICIARK